MAAIKIDMMLQDSTGSIDKRTRSTKELNRELTKAQQLGKQGVGSGDVVEYGRSRAVGAGTGAGARDFANQAQGLGGLVRIYATFAANLFAVQAAFTALSNAMDTSNMVRGLDQLGAASGQNLGTLSKRLADASDGAVTLRSAMEATAKASSSGLSSTQILEMGKAAKNASVALGVDMGDALSRLSRGISKLEPELLDELGIYVKIDDAVQKYALSVGKAASSLTDYERRQAFAVAALDQARQKFGEIDIDVNPFTRLAATFRNTAQSILDSVNSIIGPIAGLLADSAGVIGGIIALITFKLLKQAVPAFGEWRNSVIQATEQAKNIATKNISELDERFVVDWEARLSIPKLKQAIDTTKQELRAIAVPRELAKTNVFAKMQRPDYKAEASDIKDLTKLIDNRQKAIERLKQTENEQSKARVSQLQFQQNLIRQRIDLVNLLIARQDQADTAYEVIQKRTDKAPTATERANQRRYESLTRTVSRTEAISEAVQSAGSFGLLEGLRKLDDQIKEKNIKGFEKLRTTITGTFSVGLSVASRLIGGLGQIGFVIGAVIAGYELLASWLGKNSKELDEANKALEYLNDSGENLERTLARINRLDPLEKISASSITARSNALNDLASNVESSFDKIRTAAETANWFDVFIDGWKEAVGKNLLATSARSLSAQLGAALAAGLEGPEKEKFKKELSELFSTDDIKQWSKVLGESPEKFFELMPKALKSLKDFNTETQNNTSKLNSLLGKIKEINTDYSKFLISNVPTDAISQLGIKLLEFGNDASKALTDTNNQIALLAELSKDPKILGFLGPETQEYFNKSSKAIQENITNLVNYKNALQVASKTEAELVKQRDALVARSGRGLSNKDQTRLDALNSQIKALQKAGSSFSTLVSAEEKIQTEHRAKLADVIKEAYKSGADIVSTSILNAEKQAAILREQASLQLMSGTTTGISESYRLQSEQLAIQKSGLQKQLELITIQENSRVLLEKIALESKLASAKPEDRATIQADITALEESSQRYLSDGFAAIIEDLKSEDPKVAQRARAALPSVSSRESTRAGLSGLDAKEEDLRIKQIIEKAKNSVQIEKERLDLQVKRNEKEKENLSLLTSGLTYRSEYLLREENLLNKQTLSLKQKSELLTIDSEIKALADEIARQPANAGPLTLAKIDKERLRTQTLKGQAVENENLKRKETVDLINNEKGKLTESLKQLEHRYALQANINKLKNAEFEIIKSTNSLPPAELASQEYLLKEEQLYQIRNKTLEELDRRGESERSIAQIAFEATSKDQAAKTALQERQRQINVERERGVELANSTYIAESRILELAREQNKILGEAQRLQQDIDLQNQKKQLVFDTESQLLDIREQTISILLTQYQITEDQANNELRSLKGIKIDRDENNKLLEIELELKKKLRDIETREKVAQIQGPLSPAQQAEFDKQRQDATSLATVQSDGIRRVSQAMKDQLGVTENLSQRTKGYLDAMEKGFQGLADAIVTFTETGEFSWKNLINSMLADMLRFELQMQQRALFGAIRNALVGAIAPMAGPPALPASGGTVVPGMGVMAKGGAFDSGVRKFAKGGMFTNSIVDQPTTFKFAKGVGLMGEAGPEAIMPLKRDSSGNLGVRAQSGDTKVVVNNYGSEKAETRESVDSRGNRRIEVTIGEMAAGEISRSGSSQQKAMRGTFGLRPQLIRR